MPRVPRREVLQRFRGQSHGMKPPAQHRKQDMRTRELTTDYTTADCGTTGPRTTGLRNYGPLTTGPRDKHKYALRRGLGFWELIFEGRAGSL